MTILYSASTGGFYDTDIHGETVPADAVEITIELYQDLLAGQAAGQVIKSADGAPYLADRDPPTQAEIKRARIAELKLLLAASDYKALPDYDNATEADMTQRSQWRMEIRMLISELEQDGE